MSGQPDAAIYDALVAQLLEIERRASSSELTPLTASFEALDAVIGFLMKDARIVEGEATRPLGRARNALWDRMRGGKPKLLFDQPDRKGAKGAPSITSATILRSLVIIAYLSLRKAGMSESAAAKRVASELRRSGITQPNGRTISVQSIIRWHRELGGKSLKGTDPIFAQFVLGGRRALQNAGYKPTGAPITQLAAETVARYYIKLLRVAGF